MTLKPALCMVIAGLWIYPVVASAQSDYGVEINITLSAKAATHLAAKNESIIAIASYSGEPKKSSEAAANKVNAIGPDGMVNLTPTQESVEIPGKGGSAVISGKNIDKQRLSWVTGPLNVNINIMSARKASADNILDCDFIDGLLSKVQAAPITLHCGLIKGEHIETKLKP